MPEINTNPPSTTQTNRRVDDARWSSTLRTDVIRWDAHGDAHHTLDKLLDERTTLLKERLDAAFASQTKLLDERQCNLQRQIDNRFAEHQKFDDEVHGALMGRWNERWEGHTHVHELGQIAILKSETASNQRLESMNEFRATLTAQQAMFITRDQLDDRTGSLGKQMQIYVDAINSKIGTIEHNESTNSGKGIGQGMVLAGVAIVVNMVLTMVGIWISISHLAK